MRCGSCITGVSIILIHYNLAVTSSHMMNFQLCLFIHRACLVNLCDLYIEEYFGVFRHPLCGIMSRHYKLV